MDHSIDPTNLEQLLKASQLVRNGVLGLPVLDNYE